MASRNPTRIALIAVGAALIVVAAFFGLRAIFGSDDAPLVGPARSPGAVILIPGYGGGTGALEVLSNELTEAGFSPTILDVADGTGDLSGYAEQALATAEQLRTQGAEQVDVIGYSAGGVTARTAQGLDSGGLIDRVVTVASPHQGTAVAAIGAILGACPTACEQLQPESDLLESLPAASSDEVLSIYSTSDEVIRPADSSEIPGATNVVIQDLCERPVRHGEVPLDQVSVAAMTAFLTNRQLPQSCPN